MCCRNGHDLYLPGIFVCIFASFHLCGGFGHVYPYSGGILSRSGGGVIGVLRLVAGRVFNIVDWFHYCEFPFGNFLGKRPDKSVLIFAIALNLCLLGYFKYVDFLVGGLNDLFGSSISAGNIVLPLAISFFTFQQIAYLVDVYRQKVSERSFVEYFLFVTFFPQLIAGPIVHHAEVIPQFKERRFLRLSSQDLLIGLAIFSIGLYKKIVCADGIGIVADNLFDNVNADISLFDAWAGTLAYSLQIYFDFSGYSDMAMGLARIFGIRLPINFYSPYKSASIIEFWRTWHITLSRFLRDYLYIPLGGNRLGPFVRYRNLMIVMLLGGLWHGAGWNFVAWGGSSRRVSNY